MFRKTFPYALVAAMTLATACGGDDDEGTGPTDSGDTPTQAESNAMISALQSIGAFAFVGFDVNTPELAAQSTGNVPYDETTTCSGGGTLRTNGTVAATVNGTSSVKWSGTLKQTFTNCKATGNGTQFTFNGSGLTLDMTFNLTGGTYNYSFKEKGNLPWAGAGKSGSCAVDMTISATLSASQALSYSASGKYCGNNVSLTL